MYNILEKAIWRNCTPTQCKVLITILLMCNYEEQQWIWKGEKFIVKPGEMITSLNSIAKKCGNGVTPRMVRHSLDKFQQYGFLTNEGYGSGRLITITNWGLYQNLYNNVEQYKGSENCENEKENIVEICKGLNLSDSCQGLNPCEMGTENNFHKTTCQTHVKPLSPNKKDKNIRINIYSSIFFYWNGKGIIKHRNLTKKIQNAIDKALKEYSEDEILEAIDRYSRVYFDKDFYYKHTWTLEKFLKQSNGISNYSDEGIIWINYKKHKENQNKKSFGEYNFQQEMEKYILC